MNVKNTLKSAFLLCFCFTQTLAQDYDNYSVRESKGELPADFTIKSSEKYKAAVGKIAKNEKRKAVKLKKAFYLESNFSIDNLLRNGSVLYDADFSDYLRKVAVQVLGNDRKMVDGTRFYVVRSPAVNAFATNEGAVFVCMGLLAQLENEAQLGFVLSHEIIHVREKHSVNMYVKVDDINKGMSSNRVMQRDAFESQMMQKSKYGKALELEADTKGFEDYYSKSGYNIGAIEGAYDVMRFADLPFDEQKFQKTFFEDKNYVLPERFFLKEVKKIEGTAEDENDELATHPNIATRRKNMETLIATKKATGGKDYIISEAIFNKWQKVSRFEIPQLYLHHHYYQEAIYAAYLLLQDDPNSLYLKKSIAKALYGLAKFRNSEDDDVEAENADYEKQEGESQQVFHFFKQIENDELTVLATRYLWQLHRQHPKDSEILWLAEDIVSDLVVYEGSKLLERSLDKKEKKEKTKAEKASDKVANEKTENDKKDKNSTTVTFKKKSKYDKIKESAQSETEKKDSTGENPKAYSRYALVECFADSAFMTAFRQGEEHLTNKNDGGRKSRRDAFFAQRAKEKKQGVRLGADKIVIVNPYYLSIDARKKNAIQYIETEENAAHFRTAITENAALVGLPVQIISPDDFDINDTEKYNDMVVLNEWVSEQMDYGSMDFSGYRADRLAEIAKKYNTKQFVWTGVIGLRKKKNSAILIATGVISTMLILPLPLFVYTAVKPEYETLFYTLVYDTETRSGRFLKYEYMKVDDKKSILDMHLYDAFLQLKLKPKK